MGKWCVHTETGGTDGSHLWKQASTTPRAVHIQVLAYLAVVLLTPPHLHLIRHLPRLLPIFWIHQLLMSHVTLRMFFLVRMPSHTFLHNKALHLYKRRLILASAKLPPRLWSGSVNPSEIQERLGSCFYRSAFLTRFCSCCWIQLTVPLDFPRSEQFNHTHLNSS